MSDSARNTNLTACGLERNPTSSTFSATCADTDSARVLISTLDKQPIWKVSVSDTSKPPFELGVLADPTSCHEPIDISNVDSDSAITYLKGMLRIRRAEQKLAATREAGLIGGPVHLGAGQEAVAVGVAASLRKSDRVFGAHRSHSHVISMGGSLHGLFAEALGKDTGLSKGMGGSMHLWDQPNGFYGSVPIVAGTVPLAVGAGLAASMQGTGDIAVSYLGDGAVEEGIVHESLNLASVLKVPVVFVVENNLFASHMHIELRQSSDATSRFAIANGMPYALVDGNDVVAVAAAAEELIGRARRGEGPGFLEAVTYRWYGHVDWREDIDVGVHRSDKDLTNWRARCPIARLEASLQTREEWSTAQLSDFEGELADEVEDAWELAMADPYPEPAALLDRVYSGEAR